MAKTGNQQTNVAKPYHTGKWASGFAARRGLRVLLLSMLSVILYLFIGQLLVSLKGVWQILINALVLLAVGAYLFMEGGSAGEEDVAFGEIVYSRIENGQMPSSKDEARCFHPLKGFFSVLVGMLPLLLPALLFALIATKQVYRLGGLPDWVKSVERHREVALALQYYRQTEPIAPENILRIGVRLLLFPYVSLFGADNAGRMLLMERLSPLLLCIVPAFYAVGYQFGPARRARVHQDIALGKKRRAAREKKDRQKKREQTGRII